MSNTVRGPGRPKKVKSRKEIIAEKRKMRSKVQDLRASMALGENILEEGYMYRWVNDTPGKIKRYQAVGWDLVEDVEKSMQVGEGAETTNSDLGTAISLYAGVGKDNRAYRAYLMRIEEELYQEGEALKQEELDKVDRALSSDGTLQSVEGAYTPNGKPKYNTSVTRKEYKP